MKEEIKLAKLAIKKLMDKSTPIQLFDFMVDVKSDEKAAEQVHDQWYNEDASEDIKPLRYVFRDEYSFDYQGTTFWLYINGHIELSPGVDKYEVEASEPEIKVIEVEITEKDGQEMNKSDIKTIAIADKDMDDELKKLINQYSYSRNILVMEHKKQHEFSYQQGGDINSVATNDFAEFHRETIDETLRFIKERKSDEFMAAYIGEKLDTAHLYGFNEGKDTKTNKI